MDVAIKPDLEAAVIAKLTRRLLPFLFLLYIVAYLDRINVGFAALQMQKQFGFSDAVYGLGAGVFFAGYFFFQVPSNLALARVGPRRWIAALMVVWGAISSAMVFITDYPEAADWLNDEERACLIEILKSEQEPPSRNAALAEVFSAFSNWKIWLLIIVYFGATTCAYGLSLWLPNLIHNVSKAGNFGIGLLSTIPYIATAVAMVLVGVHSDRTGERRWHLALSAFGGAIGVWCAAFATSTLPQIVFLSLALLSAFSMMGPFWATSTSLLSGTAAAAGIALINSFGNLGGFFGPYVIGVVRNATGDFRGGLVIAGAMLAVSGGLAIAVSEISPAEKHMSKA